MIYSFLLTVFLSLANLLINIPEIKAETLQNSESELHLEKFKLNETITNNNQEEFQQNFGQSILSNETSNQEFSQQEYEFPDTQEENEEDWPSPIDDDEIFWFFLIDRLEYQASDGKDFFFWDAEGWVGGDYERIWIKTDGEVAFANEESGEAEVQILYGRLIDPYWDLQVGLRYDRVYGPDEDLGRVFAVIGVEGLAPGLYEVDAALFLSEDGDISARLEVEQELLITQQLILQPRFEINLSAQEIENFGIGSGVNDVELGLRLRYEINRNYAPYLGINWIRLLGRTSDFAQEEGESVDNFSVVGGIRLLF